MAKIKKINRPSFPMFYANLLEGLSIDKSIAEKIKIQDKLNPILWEDGKLKKEVRARLLKIAKAYYVFLGIKLPIKDIVMTGSLANYNWNSQSDIDVHLILDSSKFSEEDLEMLTELMFAKKKIWGDAYDITVKGFPVELFAKSNEEDRFKNKAIYSLKQGKWIVAPKKVQPEIDIETIKEKTAYWMNKIDDLEEETNTEEALKTADKYKDRIKKMRLDAVSTGGEYSIENLVFKTLRSSGYLDKLSAVKDKSMEAELSLKEESEKKKINKLVVQKGIDGMTDEKLQIIRKFLEFTLKELGMEGSTTVSLRKGRDEYITTTAAYHPFTNINYIKAGGRAAVDICRSIAHELSHNKQMELGLFQPGDYVQNIGGYIEDQANSIAGALIKKFTQDKLNQPLYEL
jgi:predicted nucleotidyltransferase